MEGWGWTGDIAARFDALENSAWTPARVLVEHRELYRVMTAEGEFPARVSGRFRYLYVAPGEAPAVGDWVAAELSPGAEAAVIHQVLPRRTVILRAEAGEHDRAQVLAANVDTALLVTSANQEFNPRRMERFLALIHEGGASPVVVLNKADLCPDLDAWLARAEMAAPGVPVHTLSALTGEGIGDLEPYCGRGSTVVLLGSSGVGKSTLTNRLTGTEVLAVKAIREADGRGRHTTSHRQMVRLASGGVIIDTPGLREVGLWNAEEGVGATFEDVEALARTCRFRDCRHEDEPGCAVRAGVEAGVLDAGRERSYRKLRRELEHLESRQDVRKRLDTKKRWKAISKQMRKYKSR